LHANEFLCCSTPPMYNGYQMQQVNTLSQRPEPSCSWWQSPWLVLNLKSRMMVPVKQCREMVVDLPCCGTASEIDIFKFFQAWFRVRSMSDPKTVSQRYVRLNHQDVQPSAFFAKMEDQTKMVGKCVLQGNRRVVLDPNDRVDMTSFGGSCQPWSPMRRKDTKSEKGGPTERHPGFKIVFDGFANYLDAVQPRCWMLEEDDHIIATAAGPDKRRWLDLLIERVSQCGPGYAVQACMLDHGIWAKVPRKRRYYTHTFILHTQGDVLQECTFEGYIVRGVYVRGVFSYDCPVSH
jgi:hypothetical protein